MQNQVSKLQQILSENAIGPEEFAYCIGIEPKQANAILLGKKRVTARLSRQIEQTFSKPSHWLDDDAQGSASDHDLFG